jgi:hypothetical protein
MLSEPRRPISTNFATRPGRQLFGTFVWVARSKRLHRAADLGLAQSQEKIQELIRRQSLEGLTVTLSGTSQFGHLLECPRWSAQSTA